MENPEELLHTLEEFSKFKPKDIPRELEEYLCFVAKTGDPVYQWSSIKHLVKEKLINVVTEFYETCPSVEIPPCPNVEIFNYDTMKSFILEKLDTFAAAPFTVQRICELLTTPRKEYNRIDKYMRALEKNILVVSTVEPGCKNTENGDSIVNGLESEHLPETSNCSSDINVVEMDETPFWPTKTEQTDMDYQNERTADFVSQLKEIDKDSTCSSTEDNVAVIEESKEFMETSDTPVNSSSITTDDEVSVEPVPTPLPTQVEDDVTSTPMNMSDVVEETTESEAVCVEVSKGSEIDEVTTEEDLKQADSTTSLKSPQTTDTEEIVPLDVPDETKDINEIVQEIASSESENSDSNQTLESSEPEIESNEVADETNEEDEIVSVDTTNLEKLDEEISSTDKIVIPNTSIDDISDEESEAEAELSKTITTATTSSSSSTATITTTEDDEIINEPLDKELQENEVVTASTDDLNNKENEDTSSSIDVEKEKIDFNEAEAACESV